MADKRKVDGFAGKGSLADKLKQRRDAIESGDLENANAPFQHAIESDQKKQDDKEQLDNARKENQDGWQRILKGQQ